jgi:phosphoribosylformylglycinamidine (FGAM) synthase-like enzyme
VQTNTVQGPGGEAGVMRIKGTGAAGTERGLAMALAGNGRWTYLDPKLGAMHAVAEAARKVACTGATPVSATNCLNFGNPEKPEIMAQLSAAIDGIAEACNALATPVTGGNVSLYNETKGEGIYPTPVLGIVGILDDVTKAVPSSFQKAGDAVLFLSAFTGKDREIHSELGSTEYAKSTGLELWGRPPGIDLAQEAALHKALAALAAKGLLHSACDISDGGSAVAFAKACFPQRLGVSITLGQKSAEPLAIKEKLFSEIASSVIVSTDPAKLAEIQAVLAEYPGVWVHPLGEVTANRYTFTIGGQAVIDEPIESLRGAWAGSLEEQLATEVLA